MKPSLLRSGCWNDTLQNQQHTSQVVFWIISSGSFSPLTSRCAYLHVSTTSPRGCWPTVYSWTLARPTCSGVQQLIVVISCPRQVLELGPTSSARQSQSEILEFTSTLTLACDAMFRKPLPAALPFFVSCAAFDVRCRRPFTKHSSSPSSCPSWTTAMLCW